MSHSIFLAKNLIYLIKNQRRSLSQTAKNAKMNKSTLHGYMTGVVPRGVENLVLLAHELNVSPGQLLFENLSEFKKKDFESFLASDVLFEVVLRPVQFRSETKKEQKDGI